jgi:hypothetical protein
MKSRRKRDVDASSKLILDQTPQYYRRRLAPPIKTQSSNGERNTERARIRAEAGAGRIALAAQDVQGLQMAFRLPWRLPKAPIPAGI